MRISVFLWDVLMGWKCIIRRKLYTKSIKIKMKMKMLVFTETMGLEFFENFQGQKLKEQE